MQGYITEALLAIEGETVGVWMKPLGHFSFNGYQRYLYFMALTLSFFSVLIMSNKSFASHDSDQEELSAYKQRTILEDKSYEKRFSMFRHKQTYFLLFASNDSPNNAPYENVENRLTDLDNVEIKYQISFKTLLAREFPTNNGYLFFAYTQQSFWQAYNKENSRPFRETSYEPEVFISFRSKLDIPGFPNQVSSIGVNHQSNGRMEPLSRSWWRVFANFVFERDNLVLFIKPWLRIPEGDEDDNPDIQDYLGYGEIGGAYYFEKHVVSFMVRNNLKSDNHGAFQLDWSIPVKDITLYVQYFNGYGESLIDYDYKLQRIGAGIILANWL